MTCSYEAAVCHFEAENLRMPAGGGYDFRVVREYGLVEILDHTADIIYERGVVRVMVIEKHFFYAYYPDRFAQWVGIGEESVGEALGDDASVRRG